MAMAAAPTAMDLVSLPETMSLAPVLGATDLSMAAGYYDPVGATRKVAARLWGAG
jgi:hypothetical protein